MVLPSSMRVFLIICFAMSFGALIINTNIMLSVHNVVSKKRLSSMFHDELRHVLYDINGPFYRRNEIEINKQLPLGHMPQTLISGINQAKDDIDASPFLYQKNFTPSVVLGHGHYNKDSFVIGIPSVKREGVSYLETTIRSLCRSMYPVNENKTSIVVFLAETDMDYVHKTMGEVYNTFTREVDTGLLQVISPPTHLYPSFNLPQTLGDPSERVQWRSKEVFDAAYLMFVCRNKADYYLMLEDDVIAVKGFVESMKKIVAENKETDFGYISLSTFNSIGKLFRRRDIPAWASFFFTFYGLKPIDWLMLDVMRIQSCNPEKSSSECEANIKKRMPQFSKGLFQHIGKMSSLAGKKQLITDTKFSREPQATNPHVNIKAEVSTTLTSADLSTANELYIDSGGMNKHFLVSKLQTDDVIKVLFSTPSYVQYILVKTGNADMQLRYCTECGLIEYFVDVSQTPSTYQQCGAFDRHGSAHCVINHQISGFQIRNTKPVDSQVWFDLIYMQ
uniref:Alpha-1,3-mannosyl-glycoprotein 4-beta-N-acetylglucosaminyltransferase A-like n=1 Tax=Ciona intestinalis TaxID=7719 RepID=F6UI12_CIOIN|nr:alpha-1,3-mannosyl-glycoprotein 4-beta-N-acetylglucosaminyltransferase A-like [Ciona intestinalis]|eukprot:XP_002120950.2 alpha-1,3-mannosyl-glycoprotein 4-beta-N-acetylglucosaminyltransferase A-like [Ciona intestinalis]